MKKCKNCGYECSDDKEICPNCGALIDSHISNKEYMGVYHSKGKRRLDFKYILKLILFFIIGFCLPYLGILIAYFLIEDKDKKKSMVIGAILSSLLSIFIPIILGFIY